MDVFSLLLILAVHAAVLIGMFGARHNKEDGKSLMVFSLMFVGMITGFFAAADIFSFYIFFEATLLPLAWGLVLSPEERAAILKYEKAKDYSGWRQYPTTCSRLVERIPAEWWDKYSARHIGEVMRQ